MKYVPVILLLVLSISCNQQSIEIQQLKTKIDNLQFKLNNTYKPGLGEFMSDIQVHHAKLWFAGTNNNWKLADFEIHEIQEALDNIQKYNSDRPEVKSISTIYPAIDSVSKAIQQKNQLLFSSSYNLLTNTCNNCHRITEHEFNVIITPTIPPISNQNFKTTQ